MSNTPPNLRNLVGLLRIVDAAAFNDLSVRLRGRADGLPLGADLGGDAVGDAHSSSPTPRTDGSSPGLSPLEACTVAAEALLRLRRAAEPTVTHIAGRLRSANQVGLLGEAMAAFASAGVIAAIWGAPPKDSIGHVTAVSMAVLGFVGAAAALVSRYLKRDLSGADGSLAVLHRKLIDASWEAELLSAKLQVILAKGPEAAASKDSMSLVERAERLGAEMYRALKDFGVPIGKAAA